MQEISEWFNTALDIVPDNAYLRAAVIAGVFVAVAKLADKLICRSARLWTRRTATDLDDRFIDIMHRPIFVTVVLIGFTIATNELELPPTAASFTLASLKSIGVLVWLTFMFRFTKLILSVFSRYKNRFTFVQTRTLPLLNNVANLVLIGAATYVFFLAWKIDVTAWLASAGIIGLALSFAAKDTLANLFAGISILADAPYKMGDFVVLESGERGQVTHIGIRSTRLLTRDDVEITVPNGIMGNTKIINESGGPHEKHRVRIKVAVAYGSDIDVVRSILTEIATTHSGVCDTPEPRVRFRSFGDSGLDFELLCWVAEPVLRGRLKDTLNSAVYKRFLDEGVEIPYPKHDLYIREMPQVQDGK